MRTYTFIIPGFFLASFANAAPVSIDTSSSTNNAIRSPGIGVTLSTTTRPYEGIGSQVATLPFFGLDIGDVYVRGLDVGYKLPGSQSLRWDLVAVPRFLGYKQKDSTVLAGLENTDYSVHGGISVSGTTGPLSMNLRLLTDLLNESGGTEVIGSISRLFTFGNVDISPALSVNWQDSNLVDHYYGIDESQTNAERVAYTGDSTFNASVSLTATYSITKSLTTIGSARFEQFGSEIKDSPIVSNSDASSVTAGLIYSF